MPPDSARLVIRMGGVVQRTVNLTASALKVGRHPTNDLVLPDQRVSRFHAELQRQAQGFTLTDVGSTFGTFVNGERLSPHVPRLLQAGDRIRIEQYDLAYQVGEGPDVEEAAPPEVIASAEGAADSPAEAPAAPDFVAAMSPSRGEEIATKPRGSREATRQTQPMPPATGESSRYLSYLPGIYHEDPFLARYLLIMESLWEPLEQRQDHIDMYFDPRTAPAAFLRWLGNWLGLAIDTRWPEARRRRLLSEAMDLYRFRGTIYGLKRMIEVCTGVTPEVMDSASGRDSNQLPTFVFRVRMRLPDERGVDRELVESLIQAHKPAHAGYVLEIAS